MTTYETIGIIIKLFMIPILVIVIGILLYALKEIRQVSKQVSNTENKSCAQEQKKLALVTQKKGAGFRCYEELTNHINKVSKGITDPSSSTPEKHAENSSKKSGETGSH